MNRILVTGATGFLGSHVLGRLMQEKNIHLIAACRDPSRLPSEFKGEVRQGDLIDPEYVDRLTRDVDVICHTAAWTSLWGHEDEEYRLFYAPGEALIQSAVKSGVKRFIFDSSVVVSGAQRDSRPVTEDAQGRYQSFWPHLNRVVDLERLMQRRASPATQMVSLRCGHFVGERFNLGILSLLIPRLRTHLVPWVAGGRARVPLVDGRDLGEAFYLACKADNLEPYESFNICGTEFPTMRELVGFINQQIGVPMPHFGVPLKGAYAFGWLMETLSRLLPVEPFLTRAIVYLGEDWYAPGPQAANKLGYKPVYHWKDAVSRQLQDMQASEFRKASLVDGQRWWKRRQAKSES